MTHSDLVKHLAKAGDAILLTLTPEKVHSWYMATGVSGEAGELLDAVTKYVAYNQEIDMLNVIEEMGDIEFYLEGLRQGLGLDRQMILNTNVAKLTRRYGLKYSNSSAQERADKKED